MSGSNIVYGYLEGEAAPRVSNFAIGVCQGPIDHFGRIWADGKLMRDTGAPQPAVCRELLVPPLQQLIFTTSGHFEVAKFGFDKSNRPQSAELLPEHSPSSSAGFS